MSMLTNTTLNANGTQYETTQAEGLQSTTEGGAPYTSASILKFAAYVDAIRLILNGGFNVKGTVDAKYAIINDRNRYGRLTSNSYEALASGAINVGYAIANMALWLPADIYSILHQFNGTTPTNPAEDPLVYHGAATTAGLAGVVGFALLKAQAKKERFSESFPIKDASELRPEYREEFISDIKQMLSANKQLQSEYLNLQSQAQPSNTADHVHVDMAVLDKESEHIQQIAYATEKLTGHHKRVIERDVIKQLMEESVQQMILEARGASSNMANDEPDGGFTASELNKKVLFEEEESAPFISNNLENELVAASKGSQKVLNISSQNLATNNNPSSRLAKSNNNLNVNFSRSTTSVASAPSMYASNPQLVACSQGTLNQIY